MLKRQYSLDKGDDPQDSQGKAQAASCSRVHKQNSAGTAHDLEMIEEIPLTQISTPSPCHRKSETVPHNCDPNVSIDTVSLH